MIDTMIKNSGLTISYVASQIDRSTSYLSKILLGQTYKEYSFYDKVYDVLERERPNALSAPRYNGVTLYPTGKAVGSFDIVIDGEYRCTMIFQDATDIMVFLRGSDGRLDFVKSLNTHSNFKNKVISVANGKKE